MALDEQTGPTGPRRDEEQRPVSTTQTPPRRLVRRTDDRVVAGVAGGIADVLDIDPVLVRIGFVVLAFAGGAGVVAYLALWLLTPEVAGGESPVAGANERGPAFWIAIGLFVLAALAIADSVADRAVVWPLVLIGAGVALWRSNGSRRQASTSSAPPASTFGADTPPASGTPAASDLPGDRSAPATPYEMSASATPYGTAASAAPDAPSAWATSHETAASDVPDDPAGPAAPYEATQEVAAAPSAAPTQPIPAWTPPPPPGSPPTGSGGTGGSGGWRPPPVARERSVLGRITIGMALLALGVLAVLDAAGAMALTVQMGFAVTLLAVGAGLVVGTWFGRARWLTLPALLLLLPGLVLSTVVDELDLPLGAGIGESRAGATAPADVDDVYELGIGELTLNLGELDVSEQDVSTSVRLGIGQATVVVPDDATVELTWQVTGGRAELFRQHRAGRNVKGTEVFEGEEDGGTLVLDVEVAFGEIVVERASDAHLGPFTGDVFDGFELGSSPSFRTWREVS